LEKLTDLLALARGPLLNRAADLRQKSFELKQQVEATGADAVVMACGSCRLNFMNGQAKTGWPVKIESLVELVGDNLADRGKAANR